MSYQRVRRHVARWSGASAERDVLRDAGARGPDREGLSVGRATPGGSGVRRIVRAGRARAPGNGQRAGRSRQRWTADGTAITKTVTVSVARRRGRRCFRVLRRCRRAMFAVRAVAGAGSTCVHRGADRRRREALMGERHLAPGDQEPQADDRVEMCKGPESPHHDTGKTSSTRARQKSGNTRRNRYPMTCRASNTLVCSMDRPRTNDLRMTGRRAAALYFPSRRGVAPRAASRATNSSRLRSRVRTDWLGSGSSTESRTARDLRIHCTLVRWRCEAARASRHHST